MATNKFRKNMGKTDRTIRIIVAAIFAVLYILGIINGTLGFVLMLLSGVFILTGSLGFCFLYPLFKVDTTSSDKEE